MLIIILCSTRSGYHHGWCVYRFCRSKNLLTAESRFNSTGLTHIRQTFSCNFSDQHLGIFGIIHRHVDHVHSTGHEGFYVCCQPGIGTVDTVTIMQCGF